MRIVRDPEVSFRRLPWIVTLLAVGLLVLGCARTPSEEGEAEAVEPALPAVDAGPPLRVAVVNEPLRYFAERVGGDAVEVLFPVPAGVDPAHWSPDAEAVLQIQEADLVLRSGADYAKWIDRVTLRSDRIVDTSEAYAEQLIPLEDQVTHSHGPGGEHSHEGLAAVTWLDLDLAQKQVTAVAEALSRARPEREQEFDVRAEGLRGDLEALDLRLEKVVWRLESDEPVAYSQPVYQYFERRYGLDGEALAWEPDAVPGDEAWGELARIYTAGAKRWMFWHTPPSDALRTALAERQVEVVVVDPAASARADRGFLEVMEANVAAIESAVARVGAPD